MTAKERFLDQFAAKRGSISWGQWKEQAGWTYRHHTGLKPEGIIENPLGDGFIAFGVPPRVEPQGTESIPG